MNTHFAVALHALCLLQQEGGGPVSAVFVAGSVGTNPVFLRRVLRDLQRAGLVEIRRGAEGGASLARPAAQITLADVYDAVHADEHLLAIHDGPNPACPVGRGVRAALTGVVAGADAALHAYLSTQSVADVLGQILAVPAVDGEGHPNRN